MINLNILYTYIKLLKPIYYNYNIIWDEEQNLFLTKNGYVIDDINIKLNNPIQVASNGSVFVDAVIITKEGKFLIRFCNDIGDNELMDVSYLVMFYKTKDFFDKLKKELNNSLTSS